MPTTINTTPAWKLNDEAFIDNPPSKKTAPHIAGAAFDQPPHEHVHLYGVPVEANPEADEPGLYLRARRRVAQRHWAALIKVGLRGSRDVKGFHGHAIIETKGKPKLLAKIAALLLVFQ